MRTSASGRACGRGAFYSNSASLDELFLALHTDRAAALIQVVAGAVTEAVAELRAAGEDSGPPLDAVVDRVISALPVSQGAVVGAI